MLLRILFTCFVLGLVTGHAWSQVPAQDLEEAVRGADTSVLKRLLERGANPNARSAKQMPLLFLASKSGSSQVVAMLIEYGADPNLRYATSRPALAAVEAKQGATLRSLILGGARVDVATVQSDTLLHRVLEADCAAELISAGVDLDARDRAGRTPLMRAAEKGRSKVVRRLLEAGALSHLKDIKGQTALDLAQAASKPAAVKLLSHRARSKPKATKVLRPAPGADLSALTQSAVGGQRIVLGPGSYRGPIVATSGLIVVEGDPKGRTRIEDGSGGLNPLVIAQGKGAVHLSHVRLGKPGGKNVVAYADRGGRLRFDAVVFEPGPPSIQCLVDGARVEFNDCTFLGAVKPSAVFIQNKGVGVVKRSTFSGSKGSGVVAMAGARVVIDNCTFSKNEGDAAAAADRSTLRFQNSTVLNSPRGGGVTGHQATSVVVRGNRFLECKNAVSASQVGHVAVTRNQIRRATARGVVLVGIKETYVAHNRFVHCKSALQLLKAGSRPAAVVENVLLDGTDTSIWVEATAAGKAVRVIGNRIVGRGLGVGAHGAQLTLLRNTITMVGKQGVSLHLQNSSSAILAGNLISGESAALTIAKSNVRSTQLRSDVVLGNIVAGDQNPSASPVTKRIRVLVERNSEPVSRVRSSLRAASQPVTATNRLIAFKALDSADRKLRFEASQLAQVRLLVEDSIGRRIQPLATLVYEGRSPVPGSVALFPEEIKASASLMDGLKHGRTPALKTLRKALEPETLAAVSSSPPSPSKALLAAVVRDLNRWISGPLVELAEGISDVSVGARHAQLLEELREEKQPAVRQELTRKANRLLLEAALPRGMITRCEPLARIALGSWAYVRAGSVWLVSESDPAQRQRIEIRSGERKEASVREPEALWICFKHYDKAPGEWVLFRPRPKAEMKRTLGWLRLTGEFWPLVHRRRSASGKDLLQARELVRKELPRLLGKTPEGVRVGKDLEFGRYYALRILAAVGEPADVDRVLKMYQLHPSSYFFRRIWTQALARIEARYGVLETGSLARMAATPGSPWRLPAAAELRRLGSDQTLSPLLKALGSAKPLALRPAVHALLDSDDPQTLVAMRQLWHRLLSSKALPWRNSLLAPVAQYLLAHGTAEDQRLVTNQTLGPVHAVALTFLDREPLTLVEALIRMGHGIRALAASVGFLDRSPGASEVLHKRMFHSLAQHDAMMTKQTGRSYPYDDSWNTSSVLTSWYRPNEIAVRFYGRFGRTAKFEPALERSYGNLVPNSHALVPWFAEPALVDRYVGWLLEGRRVFEQQLDYIDPITLQQRIEAVGKGKRPPAYALLLAALRVSTYARNVADPYPMGLERRPYLLRNRQGEAGGISGVAEVRASWADDRLRVHVRLRQEAKYVVGFLSPKRKAYPHHPYVLNGGRALIHDVVLRQAEKEYHARLTKKTADGFFVFEAKPAKQNFAETDLYLGIRFLKQRFNLSFTPSSDESGRAHRKAMAGLKAAARAAKATPANSEALRTLVKAQQVAGRLSEAWKTLQSVSQLEPAKSKDLEWEAIDMFQAHGRHDLAAAVAERALSRNPKSADHWRELLRQHFLGRRYQEGWRASQRALGQVNVDSLKLLGAICGLLASKHLDASKLLDSLPAGFASEQVMALRLLTAGLTGSAVSPQLKSSLTTLRSEAKEPVHRARSMALLGIADAAVFRKASDAEACRLRCYLGLSAFAKGDKPRAAREFRAATEHGRYSQFEHRVAEAALQKIGRSK